MAKRAKYVVKCMRKRGGRVTTRSYHDKFNPAAKKASALVNKARRGMRCVVRSNIKHKDVMSVGSF